jgi:uncharacterized cupredoxin-like copper-binding protein
MPFSQNECRVAIPELPAGRRVEGQAVRLARYHPVVTIGERRIGEPGGFAPSVRRNLMSLRARTVAIVITAAVGLLAVGCGSSGTPRTLPGNDPAGHPSTTVSATRVLDVMMDDIKFEPGQLDVKAGQTIKFVFHNRGKLVHEAVIGDAAAQDAHEKEMAGMADMPMHEPGTVTVQPGTTGDVTYTFAKVGQSLIGCHQPGHYAAGMKVVVNVT